MKASGLSSDWGYYILVLRKAKISNQQKVFQCPQEGKCIKHMQALKYS
jgi:hypothetical protein